MSQLTPSQRTARVALYNLESTVWHPGFLGQVHLVTEPVTSQSNPFLLAAETTVWHPRPHARLPFATEPVALQCNPFLLATEPPAWYPSSHTQLPFATEQLVRSKEQLPCATEPLLTHSESLTARFLPPNYPNISDVEHECDIISIMDGIHSCIGNLDFHAAASLLISIESASLYSHHDSYYPDLQFDYKQYNQQKGPGELTVHEFWETYNFCWVAFTKATDIDVLEDLGNTLIILCNGLEDKGLADYQIRVWEEIIVSCFIARIRELES